MVTSKRALRGSIFCLLGFAALAGAFGLGTVLGQQQMPPTKATTLMNQGNYSPPCGGVTRV